MWTGKATIGALVQSIKKSFHEKDCNGQRELLLMRLISILIGLLIYKSSVINLKFDGYNECNDLGVLKPLLPKNIEIRNLILETKYRNFALQLRLTRLC